MLMHPATMRQPQDDPQWLEARRADIAWRNARADQAPAIDFDSWINSRQCQQWLAADPAYQGWAEKRHAADAMQFDAWLETPEGQNWLDGEAERYEPDRSYGWSWEH